MSDEIGRGLHGVVQDNALLNKLLELGNKLRYGVSEEERMDMVNKLSAPGVKDVAYDERGIYDPAAAERYTSARLFGEKWAPMLGTGGMALAHALSSGGRKTMHALGVPGVGEERQALEAAESLGMQRGRDAWEDFINEMKLRRGR